jgi:TIR domain/Cep192 domain 4
LPAAAAASGVPALDEGAAAAGSALSDIFLSYKHAARQKTRQLASALSARGWTVWWDWNIPTRKDWQAELDAQLDAAGCVVVLWSAESVQSEWVLYEARHGQRHGKLIQALLEPLQPPSEFAAFQAVDLAGWEFGAPFHAGFDRLRAAIREMLDRRAPLAVTHSGTLARIPGEAGDVLRRVDPSPATARARPAPVMLLPPPFRDLLDRRDERATMIATLAERRNVMLAGESGSGKSALLSHVGNLDHTERFHDGVVYLHAATQSESDVAHALYETFYDVPPGVRPSAVEMRRNLADKVALLLLDDVAVPPPALSALNAYAPESAWVLSSEQMAASPQRRPVALKGLPPEDGIALFERTLARPLRPDDRGAVAQIVEALRGHPARIEQAAGVAAMHGVSAALAGLANTPNLDEQDAKSRRVLAALACGGALALEVEQCAAIAGVTGIEDTLAGLVRRGLVEAVSPGFRLAAGVAPKVEASPEFAACRARAAAAYTAFAFEARGSPRRIARLAAPMIASMAWAAEAGRSAEALQLARAIDGALAASNRWDAWDDMLTRAHEIAVRAGDMSTAGWALHQQGTRALLLDDKPEALRLLKEARSVRKRSGDAAGLSATRNNLKLLGWARWMVLLAVLGGLGVTTLGAVVVDRIIQPKIAIDPGRIEFGAQDVRASAKQQLLQIENKGMRAIDVIDVTVRGPDASSFAVTTSCDGIHVPRALACRLLVEFRPDNVGARDATIAIRLRDVKDPHLVPVRGLATATPIAVLSAQAIDFGEVEIRGGTENRSVTLRNTGSAPLAVTAIAVDGDGDFRVVGDNCQPATIAPDGQCTIDLRYAPREPTAGRARLVISDTAGGSPRTVTLSGTGHATPKLEVAPGSLEFGQQEIGTQSAARSVRLRNVGTATVEVRSITLEGSKAYSAQGNCVNAKLAPGASCALELRFTPVAIEASSGRLVIAHSAGPARNVVLAGSGFGRPAISFAPSRLDFGIVKRGAAVKPRRVTISSVGTAPLVLRPPAIEGDGRFSFANSCPERLAPEAQCSVDVRFDVSGTGKAGGRLIIGHNAAGGSATVPLSAGVEAIPPPVIESFESNPQVLERSGNVELCFRVRNAKQLRIEPAGSQPLSSTAGCVNRSVGTTTDFRLIASGDAGPAQQATATLTVRIAAAPPPQTPVILYLRADPARMDGPGEARLCFATRNAERVSIEPGGPQPQSPGEECVSRTLGRTTVYTLTASGRGASTQRSVTVEVVPSRLAPVIERFESNPRVLERPGNVELCFRARNTRQLRIEPAGSQPQSTTAGCVNRYVGATTDFRLIASGEGGPSQQATATLTVRLAASPPPQPPVVLYLRAEPQRLQGAGATRLCFATRGAERVTIEPGAPQPSSPAEGCVSRRLGSTTVFTLTASGRGASAQRNVTVEVVPRTDGPKGSGVEIPADKPINKDIITKDRVTKTPGAVTATKLLGWCCRGGILERATQSDCSAPGDRWSATEAEARKYVCTLVR